MTKTIHRLIGFTIGVVAFTVVHLIEVQMWVPWFGGEHDAWFLNQGHAAAVMVGCLFAVSLVGGWFTVSGPMMALGAWVAMTGILFIKPEGPGNIFPIVLAFGGVYALFGCWLGGWIGKELRGLVPRRHRTK